MMTCKGTPIKEIAAAVVAAQKRAAEKVGDDAYEIHVYFQSYEQQAGGGHLHYGLHCDHSYGGSEEAELALREELPLDLYHVLVPDDAGEEWDAHKSLEDALFDL